ncbi:MAG: hypothetical protein J6X77_00180 [Bacteroidales bacterium]|nr:hypothetical protein [Bacteroidales bacterium]
MKNIAVYTLTSSLHDAAAIEASSQDFLKEVFPDGGFDYKGTDYSDFGQHVLDLIYVRTGGTEGEFLKLLPKLHGVSHFYLLTSGKSNSLAASMEILSYLNQNGMSGEILHGAGLDEKVRAIAAARRASRSLRGLRLGVLGRPSDWLISSAADYARVKAALGIELLDIPMEEVKAAIEAAPEGGAESQAFDLVAQRADKVCAAIPGALRIHRGLEQIVRDLGLGGFTLRCFDLLTAFGNTGCLSLARFNAAGIPAACEGDVPALLSMAIARAVTGSTGFMANPSRMDPAAGKIVFAHCTVPFDMVDSAALDTHFESGIGVGIKGHIPSAPATILKVSGDLSRVFIAEGTIVRNLSEPDLCRTQIELCLDDPSLVGSYFLTAPIGNHHIIIPGRHGATLRVFQKLILTFGHES